MKSMESLCDRAGLSLESGDLLSIVRYRNNGFSTKVDYIIYFNFFSRSIVNPFFELIIPAFECVYKILHIVLVVVN